MAPGPHRTESYRQAHSASLSGNAKHQETRSPSAITALHAHIPTKHWLTRSLRSFDTRTKPPSTRHRSALYASSAMLNWSMGYLIAIPALDLILVLIRILSAISLCGMQSTLPHRSSRRSPHPGTSSAFARSCACSSTDLHPLCRIWWQSQ